MFPLPSNPHPTSEFTLKNYANASKKPQIASEHSIIITWYYEILVDMKNVDIF